MADGLKEDNTGSSCGPRETHKLSSRNGESDWNGTQITTYEQVGCPSLSQSSIYNAQSEGKEWRVELGDYPTTMKLVRGYQAFNDEWEEDGRKNPCDAESQSNCIKVMHNHQWRHLAKQTSNKLCTIWGECVGDKVIQDQRIKRPWKMRKSTADCPSTMHHYDLCRSSASWHQRGTSKE